MRSIPRRAILLFFTLLSAIFVASCSKSEPAGGRLLRLATTTSVTDSGLLEKLLPAFEKKSSYKIEVSAVGSGKALSMLREGAADVAITHAPAEEQALAASGEVGGRTPFMHNEFVLVGPQDQLGVVAGAGSAIKALQAIAASGKKFISRADNSGTHKRELAVWQAAGIAPNSAFIVQAKAGMGATLELASKEGAFTLSDRGTFLAKRDDLKLVIVFKGDDALKNIYSLIEPKAGTEKVNAEGARALLDFVRSDEGRALIGAYGVERFGEPLFTPERRAPPKP